MSRILCNVVSSYEERGMELEESGLAEYSAQRVNVNRSGSFQSHVIVVALYGYDEDYIRFEQH